jgi:hypothetical protein
LLQNSATRPWEGCHGGASDWPAKANSSRREQQRYRENGGTRLAIHQTCFSPSTADSWTSSGADIEHGTIADMRVASVAHQGYRTQGHTPFQTLSEGVEQMRRGEVKPEAA